MPSRRALPRMTWRILAAVVAVAAPAQAGVTIHLGVGPYCAGVLSLEGGFTEDTLCARNGVVVSAASQEYELASRAMESELHAGAVGTLFLLVGDREADASDPPALGDSGNLADLPNPDLRIRAVLSAVATEDLHRDVDAGAVHPDTVVAEGEAACPHLQRLDLCAIPLTVNGAPIPPTSHLELRLTTSNERGMAATVQVGGAEPSRIELPEGLLVPTEEPDAAAPPAVAGKESPALSPAALLAVALLATAVRRLRA